ncbi:hypothetical protein QQS21_009081, partial [Conoideocrella luteorostrata]
MEATKVHKLQFQREPSQVLFECTWKIQPSYVDRLGQHAANRLFETFDVLLEPVIQTNGSFTALSLLPNVKELVGDKRILIASPSGEITEATVESLGSGAAMKFLRQLVSRVRTQGRVQLVKLILPCRRGYIVRSDIITLRMVDSEFAEFITSFTKPQQYFANDAVGELGYLIGLDQLFLKSVAGIVVRLDGDGDADQHRSVLSKSDIEALSLSLEGELDERLSFPWLVQEIHPRKTLAIIEAGRVHPRYGGTGPLVYRAAKALGLNIIAMDNPGHWMEGSEFTDWRQAFIPLALHDPPQDDFTDRIIETIKSCGFQVDGIMTLCESYMMPVARACELLGLPTQRPLPYNTATNKYKTSIFEGHRAYQASSTDEAIAITSKTADLLYPLIIKPCNGWSSEGVTLVYSPSEIPAAVEAIDVTRHGTAFVIEPYCSGPEVDVNLILLDGEILFFEVYDDMPKSADENGSGSLNTFIELNSVFPSALPADEIAILRDSFHATLLKMGFNSGMFHIEGRMQDSAVDYRVIDGIVDLHPLEKGAAWKNLANANT